MFKKRKGYGLNEPLRHPDHKRPVTRRDFLAQGFVAGMGTVLAPSLMTLLPGLARAEGPLEWDVEALRSACGIATVGAGKIPFICFDLAGGANISGSNVLVGQRGGQLDFLTTAGYSKLGLPGDMIPSIANANGGSDFINSDYGLAFHSDSAFLRGIQEKAPTRGANTNGAVIPARSDNDTGNNPHNPMYGIAKTGSDGSLLTLIGSRNSDSGGNSMSPAMMLDPEIRPTKIDRTTDVTGLVDTGLQNNPVLSPDDAVNAMEAMVRISNAKMNLPTIDTGLTAVNPDTGLTRDEEIKEAVKCAYVKGADLVDRFNDPGVLDPAADTNIVADSGAIFTTAEFNSDSEFRKTASVMKMVIDGFAGAGTIAMGGYDYHTGDRSTGERRDLRAGRCIGACLEYAARMSQPVMIYVFSDGSLASNGTVLPVSQDPDARGKSVWTGDNSSTAASFFLVYSPITRPLVRNPDLMAGGLNTVGKQIGWFRGDGSVETAATPAGNNVNLLVEMMILNYMALHGEEGNFATLFPSHGLGDLTLRDSLTAFQQII
jgi:hypothetical protein